MPDVFVLAHTQGGNVHDITASHLLDFRSNDTNIIHPFEIGNYTAGNVSAESQYSRSSERTLGETVLVASFKSQGSKESYIIASLPVYALSTENILEITIDDSHEIWAGFGGN